MTREPGSTGPAYRITTPRLVVRCWQPSDAALLADAIAESTTHLTRAGMTWVAEEPLSLEQRVEWLRQRRGHFDLGKDYVYGIFDAGETRVFGGTGLYPRVGPRARELGYWIRAGAVGQGLAKEATGALVRVGFEVDRVERLEIHCDPTNLASAAVARRIGFRHEATRRRTFLGADGSLRDTMIWVLFADELAALPVAQMAIAAYDALGSRVL
jgi:RimJ/RimL family protein N-acetyltransferase